MSPEGRNPARGLRITQRPCPAAFKCGASLNHMKTKNTLFGLKPGKYRAIQAGGTKLHAVECTTAGDDHAMLEFCGTPFYVHLTRVSDVSVNGDIITFN